MMRNIPLSRGAQLLPFIEFLDRIGAPTDRGLERSKLPLGLRGCRHTLVSTRSQASFVGYMAEREGIEDLSWQAARGELEMLPVLSSKIRCAPTLFDALVTVCRLGHLEATGTRCWLEAQGDVILLCHRSAIEAGSPGANHLAMTRTALLLSIVRTFTESEWAPTECGSPFANAIGPMMREALRDARIQSTPEHGWMRIPRSILARPPRTRAPVETKSSTEAAAEPALDLVGSLAQALRPYLADGAPSIQDAADLAGTSVRSLQRSLHRAGASYRGVLQRARFELARELLELPEIKIVEVAFEAGYSDAAHFTRSFRRLAGMTPTEYRATPGGV
jgi:AraC-like DNA-binding protein